MSSSAPTVDASPESPARGEPPPPDGWPGGLAALRAELDRIDDSLHDLLMQRARVVEHVARSGKPAAFRPGREAAMIRRLIGRHAGSLPRQAIFCLWRELLAGTTSMQGPMVVAVCDPAPGAGMTQVAREHFGVLTPLRSHGSAAQALADVSAGAAAVAVLPFPAETNPWWTSLLHREPRMHITARLPFWTARPEGAPTAQAVVVAASAPDPSGDDRSFLGLERDAEVSRARIASALAAAGLTPETMVLSRDHVLVEVGGLLADDDPRLGRLGPALRRPVVLGGYAVPIAGGAA